MMALLRLNTDIPNDVFPSNCRQGTKPHTYWGEGKEISVGAEERTGFQLRQLGWGKVQGGRRLEMGRNWERGELGKGH